MDLARVGSVLLFFRGVTKWGEDDVNNDTNKNRVGHGPKYLRGCPFYVQNCNLKEASKICMKCSLPPKVFIQVAKKVRIPIMPKIAKLTFRAAS